MESNDDCNRVMSTMTNHFHIIDLDPCGSPSAFTEKAVRSIKSGGLLCIASTEDPSLDPKLCESRYGGRCFNREVSNIVGQGCSGEIYIRLLLAHVMSVAKAAGRKAVPLLSLNLQFFRRVYVRIEALCPGENTEIPLVSIKALPKNKQKNVCWELYPISQVSKGEEMHVAGPMYGGHLHSFEFVNRLWIVMKSAQEGKTSSLVQKVRNFGSRARLEPLLRLVFQEAKTAHQMQQSANTSSLSSVALDSLLCCHEPAGRQGSFRRGSQFSDEDWKKIIKELKKSGFYATQSHIDGFALKTNASWKQMVDAVHKVRNLKAEETTLSGANDSTLDKLRAGGAIQAITVQEDSPSCIAKEISSNRSISDRLEIFPPWLKDIHFPSPRGLPSDVVNGDCIDPKLLRASIKSLLSSTQLNQHKSDLWHSADKTETMSNEESTMVTDMHYRHVGRYQQVIVVGEGAKLAVKRGAGMHLHQCDQSMNLNQFSSGISAEEMNEIAEAEVENEIFEDIRPVEGVEDLSTALRMLRPYGIIVLRSGRHEPLGSSNFPPVTVEGAAFLADDSWNTVIASNIACSQSNEGGNKKQKSGGGSQRGDSTADTFTVMTKSVGFCGVVLEAPPPPLSGHALCVSGGKASVIVEGCLLRGPTNIADNVSVKHSGQQQKKRKKDVGSTGGTLRGCVCAADGAFLKLVHCLIRGGFGERSRKLVAAAAEAAATKAKGFNESVLSSSFKKKASPVTPLAECSLATSTNKLINNDQHRIGGKGAGMAIGGAGVFVVGKAVCEMEGGIIDGCKGAGMEARQGGRIYVHSGGGISCISHCAGAGILTQSHGSATMVGPGVGITGCLGEASLLVGSNASLDCSNSVAIHSSRGHGLLAHAGAAVKIQMTHFDDSKQCGICCRGDGTTAKLDGVLVSRSRLACISSGDRAKVFLLSENTLVTTTGTELSGSKSVAIEEISGGRIELNED